MADETTTTTTETATEATSPLTDWRATLPEDIRGEKSLADFKDVGSLAQSFIATKKLVGQRTEGMVKVPGEKATPEEKAAFHAALGVPASPDLYQIQRPEVALDGTWDQTAEKEFLALAHSHGLPPKAVQDVISFYGKWEASKLAASQREAKQVEATLRQEWGPAYDANVGRANRALGQFGSPELDDYLGKSGLGRHPLMVKAWAAVGNALVEHGAMGNEGDMATSAEDATEQLQKIYNDKQHPYNNPGAKGWEEASQTVLALRRLALGSENRKLVEYR